MFSLDLPASQASPRTGKLSAQLTDEVPERSFTFLPQGEGGPLAVDEVSERCEGFHVLRQKGPHPSSALRGTADATFPVRGEGFGPQF